MCSVEGVGAMSLLRFDQPTLAGSQRRNVGDVMIAVPRIKSSEFVNPHLAHVWMPEPSIPLYVFESIQQVYPTLMKSLEQGER